MPKWSETDQRFARESQKSQQQPEVGLRTEVVPLGTRPQGSASNDNGDVSWVVPRACCAFRPSSGDPYHAWPAAVTPATGMSHKGQLAGAKALAASIIDLLTSPELLAKARAEFEVEFEAHTLFLPVAAGCQAGSGTQPPRDGEVPRGHAQVLFEQDAAFN